MKFNTIVKLFTALAAAVGAVYIVATYGDKIVEWAKGIMSGCCCKSAVNAPIATESDFTDKQEEAPVQAEEASEPAAPEAAAPEAAAPEEPTPQEGLSEDAIPVANEEDFEG